MQMNAPLAMPKEARLSSHQDTMQCCPRYLFANMLQNKEEDVTGVKARREYVTMYPVTENRLGDHDLELC